jgi:Helix-turn-helix domain
MPCSGLSLMTVAELAAEWRQSREAVYRKVRAGRIPSDERAAIRIPRAELERIYEMSTSGGGSFAGFEYALGRSSLVDDPAERDGTSDRREAVEPAPLAGDR